MAEYTGRVAAMVIPRTAEERYVLFAKRKDNGDWELPGGKEHIGEGILETAEREIKEEFSLDVEAEEADPENSWTGGGYDIVPVYAEHGYDDLETQIREEEMTDHSDYVWIDTENLGRNLEDAREKIGEEIEGLKAFDLL